MMEYKKISVIVPIYNRENTIEKCIKSVKEQTYSNWELILVNDGSKDSTLEKCRILRENDERIKIITQENQGVSVARNEGIKNSTGEFLLFLDSDDYIETNTVEIITNCIQQQETDLIVSGYYLFRNGEKKKKEIENNIFFDKYKILEYVGNINNFYFAAVTGKIFKREIIEKNNIKFDKDMNLRRRHLFYVRIY